MELAQHLPAKPEKDCFLSKFSQIAQSNDLARSVQAASAEFSKPWMLTLLRVVKPLTVWDKVTTYTRHR